MLRVAWVGDFRAPEFNAPRELIERDAEVCAFSAPRDFLAAMQGTDGPDLVVIAQARPRQWDGAWIAELRRGWPLVRVVAILGTWCEGETRTGVPLDADVRVFWYRFSAWWSRQIGLLASGRAAEWSNHESHGRHEWRKDGLAGGERREGHGLVLIAAGDRESAEGIAMACELGGWAGVWVRLPSPLPVVSGAAALVYDGGQLEAPELASIARLRDQYGPLPVVALADFPAGDRSEAAKEVGVGTVLGKPFFVDELSYSLRRSAS